MTQSSSTSSQQQQPQQQPEIFSAFHYGNVLQSTINAANLLRAQTNTLTFPSSEQQPHQLIEDGSKKDKTISPFDPEAIVPLPFQLTDYKARSVGTTVWKRNERERYRVRCVNEAYELLRDQLPFDEDEKRLSKVETLRLAIIYIRHLEAILIDERHVRGCACFDEFQRQLIESESKRFR